MEFPCPRCRQPLEIADEEILALESDVETSCPGCRKPFFVRRLEPERPWPELPPLQKRVTARHVLAGGGSDFDEDLAFAAGTATLPAKPTKETVRIQLPPGELPGEDYTSRPAAGAVKKETIRIQLPAESAAPQPPRAPSRARPQPMRAPASRPAPERARPVADAAPVISAPSSWRRPVILALMGALVAGGVAVCWMMLSL